MYEKNIKKQKQEIRVPLGRLLPAVALSFMLALNASMTVPLTVQAKATMVYIAPQEGEKYHSDKDCRGLRNANSIKKVRLRVAKNSGYEPCKICKPKQ